MLADLVLVEEPYVSMSYRPPTYPSHADDAVPKTLKLLHSTAFQQRNVKLPIGNQFIWNLLHAYGIVGLASNRSTLEDWRMVNISYTGSSLSKRRLYQTGQSPYISFGPTAVSHLLQPPLDAFEEPLAWITRGTIFPRRKANRLPITEILEKVASQPPKTN